MARIPIVAGLSIGEDELEEQFILASGPGGQNVNKVASAVQLRFDVARSPSLPEDVKRRLAALAGTRLTKDGVLVLTARRFRSQERNRADARERLISLIGRAAATRVARIPTKPSASEKRRRLEKKSARAALKRLRAKPAED